MSLENKIWEKLKEVNDPELGVGLVDLGLIYDVREEDGEVEVDMTLTSMGCPLAGEMKKAVEKKVYEVDGVKSVLVEIVWEPMWTIEKASDEVRAELGWD